MSILMSVDMSMNSTGVCILDAENKLIDFGIIKTINRIDKGKFEQIIDDEDRIIEVVEQITSYFEPYDIRRVVIEGLSYYGKSAKKDVIAGMFWCLKTELRKEFPHVLVGVIPVLSWRSKILTRQESKEAKNKYSPKADAIKIATVEKLPITVRNRFISYIKNNKLPKKSIYDLTDSFFF